MSQAARTEEMAARWLLRREEVDWSEQDQAHLEAWLDVAVENKIAYWRLEHGWRRADRLAALRRPPEEYAHRSVIRRPWRIAAAVVPVFASLILVFAMLPSLRFWNNDSYATPVGGRQIAQLSDGSKVELNTATTLRTAVNNKTRNVWLDAGEAYFEVAHDPARPFVVHAGSDTVTVLGTKFSVRRKDDQLVVAVYDGRVQVDNSAAPAGTKPTIVTKGEVVLAEKASTLATSTPAAKLDAMLGWRRGLVTFDQSTLAEVASEINRYNRKQLVIADPAVAQIRIGGSFEPSNVAALARLLHQAYGLKVDDRGDRVIISN
ncbi:FecR family protein [Undibacterium sp.]|jgi:transmembrane sensor|uniref:FecR family protein n=1 Tax=Undibacterium sp. TaxID=1914977 RepID=UPI002CDBD9A1|nr:FecR domain-containing protein [Undibacterium sp.]HTD03876.1 FecR domain-containing protein [Undibacterium sp.]